MKHPNEIEEIQNLTDIKIGNFDTLFYKEAKKLSSFILKYKFGNELIMYINGTYPIHLNSQILNLNLSKTLVMFSVYIIIMLIFIIILETGFLLSLLLGIGGFVIVCKPFVEIRRKYKKNEFELNQGIENLVQELAILLAAGMNPESALRLPRSKRKTYDVMHKLYEHIRTSDEKGLSINSALLSFCKIYRNKYLNKLNILISQSKKKGTSKQTSALSNLAKEIMAERKMLIRKKAETLSTKMLMPLMLSMMGIIAMIMLPIFMQLAG